MYLPKHKARGAKGKMELEPPWAGRWGQFCPLQGSGTLVRGVGPSALQKPSPDGELLAPRVGICSAGFSTGIFPKRDWRNLVPSNLVSSAGVLTVCLLWMLRLVRGAQAMVLLSCLDMKIILIGYLEVWGDFGLF